MFYKLFYKFSIANFNIFTYIFFLFFQMKKIPSFYSISGFL